MIMDECPRKSDDYVNRTINGFISILGQDRKRPLETPLFELFKVDYLKILEIKSLSELIKIDLMVIKGLAVGEFKGNV